MDIEPFHWKNHNWNFRRKFLEGINNLDFSLKAFIFKNPFDDSKYQKAVVYLLTEKDVDCLIIDGKKPKHYRNKFRKALRMKGVYLKKFATGNDRSYPALRVADFCAGLLRSYYENPEDKVIRLCYEKLKSKILVTFLD